MSTPASPINPRQEPLLTAKEAAAILRVSEATVRRLIRQRKLPGTRIGRDYRIPHAQLLKSLYSPQ